MYKCIKEWGIENKVHSLTVDNAGYNDSCLRILLDNFSKTRKMVCGGKPFHVRCCAHILNLLVQEGLHEILQIIDNVRESIKFLNQSEMRLKTFTEIASQLQLKSRKLVINRPTQRNSTFEMLTCAMKFKDVFPRFAERDSHYKYFPSDEDWRKVEAICQLLEVFNSVTSMVSGSDYPTANLYLSEVYIIKELLN